MKLWLVHPKYLPGSLLLRQHQTIHLLAKGAVDPDSRGGMGKYRNHVGFLAWLHDVTVQEMLLRNGNHASPLLEVWRQVPERRRKFNVRIRREAVQRDIAKLRTKVDAIDKHGRMNDARVPLDRAGYELLDLHKGLMRRGSLPAGIERL